MDATRHSYAATREQPPTTGYILDMVTSFHFRLNLVSEFDLLETLGKKKRGGGMISRLTLNLETSTGHVRLSFLGEPLDAVELRITSYSVHSPSLAEKCAESME